MKFFTKILNLPWSIAGFLVGLISLPLKVYLKDSAMVFEVKNIWWYRWLPGKKNVRALNIGNVIILSPSAVIEDLKHELVHVNQHEKLPFIFPIIYHIENLKTGYKENKYEKEAYRIAGNKYVG